MRTPAVGPGAGAGGSHGGWWGRRRRAGVPSTTLPRPWHVGWDTGLSCAAVGRSTRRAPNAASRCHPRRGRRDEARPRDPRPPRTRRDAARPQGARRRGFPPRLGAALRARRTASPGGGERAAGGAHYLPAGAAALAARQRAAHAAGRRAPPGASRARRRPAVRVYPVELSLLSLRRPGGAPPTGRARLL